MKIKVHIQPNARKNKIVGKYGDAIKIKLVAPATEGKANEALIDFLAKTFGIAKSKITILHGKTSRQKLLEIS